MDNHALTSRVINESNIFMNSSDIANNRSMDDIDLQSTSD
jgi:hypothetical protein